MIRFVASVFACIALLQDPQPAAPTPAAPKAPKTAGDWNSLGVKEYEAKSFDSAIQMFQRAGQLAPDDGIIKKNLGNAYNARGIERYEQHWVGESVADFERAVKLLDDPNSKRNLALAWRDLRQFARAEAALLDARAQAPDDPAILRDLALVYYATDDLTRAIECLKRRAELGDDAFCKGLLAQYERENAVSSEYVDRSSNDFTLKFLGKPEDFAIADQILTLLEEARADVGSELGAFPRDKTTVLLYSREDFQKATAAHGWVGGLFDGKIRLPVDDFERERATIKRTACHEYTHRVVSELAPLCPLWFNEGLAMFLEGGDPHAAVRTLIERGGEITAFSAMPASWFAETDADKVRLWYAESRSFVGFFHARYGTGAVRSVLADIGRGNTLDQAFTRVAAQDVAGLDALWRREVLHQ